LQQSLSIYKTGSGNQGHNVGAGKYQRNHGVKGTHRQDDANSSAGFNKSILSPSPQGHHQKIIGANSPNNGRMGQGNSTSKHRGHSVDVYNNSVDMLSPRNNNKLGSVTGPVSKNPKSHHGGPTNHVRNLSVKI
jgi:hypothetical protein